MDHARRGEAALTAKNNAEAITHYTAAIAATPTAPTYYIKRSTALQRTQKYAEALVDADVAVTLAFKRAKRELIAQAQLRRGIALFNLQRYGDAKACIGWAKKLDDKDKLVGIWEGQVEGKLRGCAEGDEKASVTVAENPSVETPVAPAADGGAATAASKSAGTAKTTNGGSSEPAVTSQPPAPPTQTPATKIRHEWYQNNENVYVTLLAKGVPKEKASVEIEEQSLSISFPLVTGSSYDFSLDPLYAPVNASASSHKILSTKIEITLKKSTPGHKWATLEGTSTSSKSENGVPTAISDNANPAPIASNIAAIAKSSGPSYPTSSRTGPKNWDLIADSYSKPKSAESKSKASDDEPTGKPESTSEAGGEKIYIDEDEDGGDDVNGFFKKLYAGASDETKRAMMKSYQESGGTALSTNWDEVKKGPVQVSPPDGMEAKAWES